MAKKYGVFWICRKNISPGRQKKIFLFVGERFGTQSFQKRPCFRIYENMEVKIRGSEHAKIRYS